MTSEQSIAMSYRHLPFARNIASGPSVQTVVASQRSISIPIEQVRLLVFEGATNFLSEPPTSGIRDFAPPESERQESVSRLGSSGRKSPQHRTTMSRGRWYSTTRTEQDKSTNTLATRFWGQVGEPASVTYVVIAVQTESTSSS